MKEVNSVSDATNTYGEDIKLTTTDASTLYKTIITELEKGAGEPLYPGDERRIFGEALVPVFVAYSTWPPGKRPIRSRWTP